MTAALQVRVVLGKKDERVHGPDDAEVVVTVGAADVALDPTVGTSWTEHYVEVETHSELTRGMTVIDRLNVSEDDRNRSTWEQAHHGARKAKICWEIDNQRWKRALLQSLR